VGTCAADAAQCQAGELCVRVDSAAVDADDVCVPTCEAPDRSSCFPGAFACAPDIEIGDEVVFSCVDDFGAHQAVCLP
jgi:hypothetical protein